MKHKFAACLFLFSIVMLPTSDAMKKGRLRMFSMSKAEKSAMQTYEEPLRSTLNGEYEEIFQKLVAENPQQISNLPKDFLNELFRGAIKKCWIGSVKALLERGVDFKNLPQDFLGSLLFVGVTGQADLVGNLLGRGEVNFEQLIKAFLDFLLLGAIEKGQVDSVRNFLEKGASPLARRTYNYDGSVFSTAFQLAILNGTDDESKQMLEFLLDKCGDEDIQMVVNERMDPRGNTLLHIAAGTGKQQTCCLLVSRGADPAQKNLNGKAVENMLPGLKKR